MKLEFRLCQQCNWNTLLIVFEHTHLRQRLEYNLQFLLNELCMSLCDSFSDRFKPNAQMFADRMPQIQLFCFMKKLFVSWLELIIFLVWAQTFFFKPKMDFSERISAEISKTTENNSIHTFEGFKV